MLKALRRLGALIDYWWEVRRWRAYQENYPDLYPFNEPPKHPDEDEA